MGSTATLLCGFVLHTVLLSCCFNNCPCHGAIEDRTGNCAPRECATCTADGYGWCDVAVSTPRGSAQCVPLPNQDDPSVAPAGCSAAQWHSGFDSCPGPTATTAGSP